MYVVWTLLGLEKTWGLGVVRFVSYTGALVSRPACMCQTYPSLVMVVTASFPYVAPHGFFLNFGRGRTRYSSSSAFFGFSLD